MPERQAEARRHFSPSTPSTAKNAKKTKKAPLLPDNHNEYATNQPD
jgi:hypothetical protein